MVTSEKHPNLESFRWHPFWCRSSPGSSRRPPSRCCCPRPHRPKNECGQCQGQTDADKSINVFAFFRKLAHITSIPCQFRHPSQPPVPSLYLRQSWKPSRTTAGAVFPPRNQRKSFALTREQDYFKISTQREVTSEKLLL